MLQREALTDETSEKEGGREVKCQERGPSVPEIETNVRRAKRVQSHAFFTAPGNTTR